MLFVVFFLLLMGDAFGVNPPEPPVTLGPNNDTPTTSWDTWNSTWNWNTTSSSWNTTWYPWSTSSRPNTTTHRPSMPPFGFYEEHNKTVIKIIENIRRWWGPTGKVVKEVKVGEIPEEFEKYFGEDE